MPEIRWVVWMLAVMWWVKYFVNLRGTASWVETAYVVGIGVILYVWFLFEMRWFLFGNEKPTTNSSSTHREFAAYGALGSPETGWLGVLYPFSSQTP